MAYRRFRLSENALAPATLANPARLRPETAPTVARLATVAGQNVGNDALPVDVDASASSTPAAGAVATAPLMTVPDFDERAAILEHEGGHPRPWAEAMARLECTLWPSEQDERWRQVLDDAGRFLDQWREPAERLGWKPRQVLDPQSGIIWHVQGDSIETVNSGHVIVCRRNGTRQRLYRTP